MRDDGALLNDIQGLLDTEGQEATSDKVLQVDAKSKSDDKEEEEIEDSDNQETKADVNELILKRLEEDKVTRERLEAKIDKLERENAEYRDKRQEERRQSEYTQKKEQYEQILKSLDEKLVEYVEDGNSTEARKAIEATKQYRDLLVQHEKEFLNKDKQPVQQPTTRELSNQDKRMISDFEAKYTWVINPKNVKEEDMQQISKARFQKYVQNGNDVENSLKKLDASLKEDYPEFFGKRGSAIRPVNGNSGSKDIRIPEGKKIEYEIYKLAALKINPKMTESDIKKEFLS